MWVPFICIPTSLGVHPLQPCDRVSMRPALDLQASQALGETRCHTCMESALTISPPSRWPSCRARVDLPVPVAPRITTRGSVRRRPRNPELTGTARAAAAAAILKRTAHAPEQLSPWQQSVRRRGSPALKGGCKRGGNWGTKGPSLGGLWRNCLWLAGINSLTCVLKWEMANHLKYFCLHCTQAPNSSSS